MSRTHKKQTQAGDAGRGPAGWVRAVAARDVPSGRAARVQVSGAWLAICNDGGRYVAVDDACPHEGGSLGRGHVADGCLVCSLHQWPFSLTTGLADPRQPTMRLRFYPCEVRGGQVYVDPSHPLAPDASAVWPDERAGAQESPGAPGSRRTGEQERGADGGAGATRE